MLNCDYTPGCDVKIVAHYTTILMLCEVQVDFPSHQSPPNVHYILLCKLALTNSDSSTCPQVYGEKVGHSKQCSSLPDTEPDAPIENDGCYYDR